MYKPSLITLTLSLLLFFFSAVLFGQQEKAGRENTYRFVFYNVENFFDSQIDTSSSYHEFEPDGSRHWTYRRYLDKRNKIYQVISAIGGWQEVTLMAFAEIENRYVLEDLITTTPLKNSNYAVIHTDSKDERGIDVGLIYLADDFTPLKIKNISVVFDSDTNNKTRDILYVKGLLNNDSIHVLINHWPSRYGGLLETVPLRITAATTLKKVCDSICQTDPNANILLMGDFNDDSENESMLVLVGESDCNLTNLPLNFSGGDVKGTLKYQGIWNTFDQILVSGGLFNGKSQLTIKNKMGNVYDPPFLLEEDKNHSGYKPFRTYSGYIYNAGFSDHLPVFVDIYSIQSK